RTGSETDRLAAYAPAIFTYMLWIVTFTLVQRLIISTIDEKANRTIELILSSITPMEFMAGKVLGGVLEGLTVLLSWMVTFYLAYLAAGYFTAQYLKGIDLRILFTHKDQLVFFGVYFTLGFVLFAALVVLLLAIYGTTWAGAKLFRVGILLYGKRPSLPEVLKILRTPEGRAAARVT